jgi:glycosyltransferase involved in cell wall biosynthesis
VRRFRPDAIYERYNLFTPAGVWAKRRFGLPLFLEVNAPLFEERRDHGGIALQSLARWSQQYAWRGADIVAPVTRVLADSVELAGVPTSRIAVIPNAINAGQFANVPDLADAKQRLGLAGRLVLGFTGFVREWHGIERVLEFMASAGRDDLFLLLVGDGPARASLERRANELGIAGRLRITGIVARDDIVRHVAAFDVALQPNVVAYASPLKIFEYLALGRPILAPALPNICEILENGKNAILFDAHIRRSALQQLCSDADLRRRLALAARRTIVERRISWDQNASRVVALLEGCAHGSGQGVGAQPWAAGQPRE